MRVPKDRQHETEARYQAFLDLPWTPDFASHPTGRDAGLECVLVEPRAHPRMRGVLSNMSHMLPHAALTVVTSAASEAYVRGILGERSTAKVLPLAADNLTPKEYSALLSTPAFYDQFTGEKLLFFQTDTGVRKNSILRFLEYDFIGAPWDHLVAKDPRVRVGNGGFSLRSRGTVQRWARDERPNPAFEMMAGHGEPEDAFFARCMYRDPAAVIPTIDVARQFSVEAIWHPDPMGFHQPHLFYEGPVLERLLFEGIDLPSPPSPPSPRAPPAAVLRVQDAWVELANGRYLSDSRLLPWLQLGVGPCGVTIPPGSRLPVDLPWHDGTCTWLCYTTSDGGKGRAQLQRMEQNHALVVA